MNFRSEFTLSCIFYCIQLSFSVLGRLRGRGGGALPGKIIGLPFLLFRDETELTEARIVALNIQRSSPFVRRQGFSGTCGLHGGQEIW